MALRPPSTPRASSIHSPSAISTPTSLPFPRRRSLLPQQGGQPLHQPESELDSLREALKMNDPRGWGATDNNLLQDNSPAASVVPRKLAASSAMKLNTAGLRASNSRPTTPTSMMARTPTTPIPPMPTVSTRAKVEIGDRCKVEVNAVEMHGVLRFLGKVDGKDGTWAGVELEGEWRGKGKNDGSVAGVQYFACPPMSGLFLPTAKVKPIVFAGLSPSSSSSSLAPPAPPLSPSTPSHTTRRLARPSTFGTARANVASPTPTSPSKPPRTTPAAPSTPSAFSPPTVLHNLNISQTSHSSSAATAAQATPKARTARPSLGGALSSHATPKASTKTIGTPRRSLGPASLATPKRPGSSLRNYPVPPLPTSTMNGGGGGGAMLPPPMPTTPSHPPGHQRRTSMASSISSHKSRASITMSDASDLLTSGRRSVLGGSHSQQSQSRSHLLQHPDPPRSSTPSLLRSASRASSVVSNHSAHSSASFGGVYAEELRDAREREKEVRNLLEASERIGREVEERLARKEVEERLLKGKVAELEEQVRRVLEDKDKDILAATIKASAPTDASTATESLQQKLIDLTTELSTLQSQQSKQSASWATKDAYQTSEISTLRDRSTASAASVSKLEQKVIEIEDENEDLKKEVVRLKEAGLKLCESLNDFELAKLEAEEKLEEVLAAGGVSSDTRSLVMGSSRAGSPNSSPSARLSLNHSLGSSHASAAAAIDAESAMAEVEHLRTKLGNLEESLEEARGEIESLRNEEKKRRKGMMETETGWRAEKDNFKADADRAAKKEAKLLARISELEFALSESQTALEAERNEIEGLRHDTAPSSQSSAEQSKNNVLVNQLRDDLKHAEKEIVRLQLLLGEDGELKRLREDNEKSEKRNKELLEEAKILRDAQHGLEVTVENLMAEMTAEATQSPSLSNSTSSKEIDSLRAKLQEADAHAVKERTRFVQEIAELESVIESNVYKADELEAELAKYKKLATTNGNGTHSRTASSATNSNSSSAAKVEEGVQCEMCGDAGHDLDNCPIFGGSNSTKTMSPREASKPTSGDYCDDCEEYGHTLEDCPLANECF